MIVRALCCLGFVAVTNACAPEDWGPDALSRGSGASDDETLALGKSSYELYCVGCHGPNGDGEGPAALHLDPKPRDFRVGRIKFASVAAGQAPFDDDYLRVITRGLQGTAMPTFRLLPLEERSALVAYLQTFRTQIDPPGEAVLIPKDPYRKKPEKAVAEGERLFHGLAACSSCHPAYVDPDTIKAHVESFDMKFQGLRARAYQPEAKESDWGAPIAPPDFLQKRIKTGNSKEDIVRVIATGVTGTAMPNWSASLTPKQLWALAYYVESIAHMRESDEGRALHQRLTGIAQ